MSRPAAAWKRVRYALRSPAARLGIAADVVLLAAFVSVLSAHWWPQREARQDVERRIEETRRAVMTAMQANELLDAYAAASQAADAIERKLNAPVKQAELVRRLAELARRHGVRIVSESYEEGRRQAEYSPLFLQVALQGRYAGVRGLLSEVPTLPLWAEIDETRLERLRRPAGLIKAHVRLRAVRRAGSAEVSGS